MRVRFWAFMVVAMSGTATGVYNCFFDKNESLSRSIWTTAAGLAWAFCVIAMAPAAKRYLNLEQAKKVRNG